MSSHPIFRVFGASAILLAGCSTQSTYNKAPATGYFSGEPRMVAIAPNTFFFFQPERDQKFAFTTHRRDPALKNEPGRGRYRDELASWKIVPEDMITTGANVPRRLWFIRGFGAFDFTRAAIIHDWLFEAHHRYEMAAANYEAARLQGDQAAMERNRRDKEAYQQYAQIDQNDAADILAECIKVTMVQSANILEDARRVRSSQVGRRAGPEETSTFRDLGKALQVNRPDAGTLWAYHYFVSDDCFVGKSKEIWRYESPDIAIYRALTNEPIAELARKKGYMSDWLIHRLEKILEQEGQRHRYYERAREQGLMGKRRSTSH